MPSRVLVAACAALSLAACASGPPERPGDGFAPTRRGPDRPDPPHARGQLFISPAGEPFRAPFQAPYPVAAWFAGADTDHDGALSRDEMAADALRFFATLDADHDGVLDGFEVGAYETKVAPEILGGGDLMAAGGDRGGGGGPGRRGGGRRGGGDGGGRGGGALAGSVLQGASPYALLREPEPVMGADADFNRRVTRDETVKAARARFALLDKNADGRLTLAELPTTMVQARSGGGGPRGRKGPGAD